ncbi:type II toxin-antitoxin system Phd/YefM family antitoxin [Thiorhodococcus mannitoliphagus]|uniref:Antitoxin n=1 Tax=Thiorhodococcus mannitoliphagus TaxID=329406 RepID=A0A6P1DQJ5_9GAMM|nr:type II toxin-antitoxin system Phd/YefM family antitoxin [Thiorhodococcus mannitoliphagus]NEX19201.1 type II toxin-antitoxin system Phd/YefM family antitoxin [Thiorhodococcus mannitoliphagus]
MTETSIADAKIQLTRLIHQAERGEAVHITRCGKPVAVLLSEDAYTRLRQGRGQAQPDFWDLITKMRADPAFEPVDWPKDEDVGLCDARAVAAMRAFPKIVGVKAETISEWIAEGRR